MTQRQNMHYKIASQQKLKSDTEYIPKSAQIKLELYVEKGTKEGEAFQALQEKHLQVLADCQKKIKSLVIEAGDINLVENKKLAIVSFVESTENISKGFLMYGECHNITPHQCSVDVIELYSDHLAVHLVASKERLPVKYQKIYELEEMPTASITYPQATVNPDAPPTPQPAASETFGERARRLFDERAAAADSRDTSTIEVSTRPSTREQHPRPETYIDAVLYLTLKTTLEVIFVSGWGNL